MDSSRKVIISGTGRAGTTFLVQLLTELGLETGYTPGDEHRHIDEHSQGGLEHNLPGRRAPTTLRSFCGSQNTRCATCSWIQGDALHSQESGVL